MVTQRHSWTETPITAVKLPFSLKSRYASIRQPSTPPPVLQTMMFRDQVGVLASWFKGWNECEQTVALLSLLKRVSPTQARFLQLCLEHSLAECTELQVLEGEANNPGRTTTCLVRCIYRHSQTLRLLFCSSHCTLLLQQLHSSYHKGVNCEIGKKKPNPK